ncbi:MAG: alanyl-tRNA synthetase [Bradymonadia bacterium]|jgi:alanyl-tRNA synthetase
MESNQDETGEMTPLPLQSVDTGMGLDRIAAVMAGVDNVFKTGLFENILKRTHFLRTGEDIDVAAIYAMPEFASYCVVADHVRTSVFSVCDGAKFGNAGREYVLRRILRRAVRHGRELGFTEPFLCDVADAVIEDFQHVYPELRFKGDEAKTIIRNEEKHFLKTLDKGIQLFDVVAESTIDQSKKTIEGTDVFKLHDTFGFPPDLTEILARERSLEIDWTGYKAHMQQQKASSKKADARYTNVGEWEILQEGAADKYVGYDSLSATSDVLRFRDLGEGKVEICLRETPFYAESGGQVGDRGTIVSEDGMLELHVLDTKNTPAGITHTVEVRNGELSSSRLRKPVTATVDGKLQFLTACNHTATHLLHSALHKFVSERAFQAGSNVSAARLRFDFSFDEPVPQAKLEAIESWVNARIRENTKLKLHLNVRLEEAERMGAMMMFGEKYGEEVRVVEVPGVSTELCGGIHVSETNDIAYFRITSETGVAAGVRRIEAVTNASAFELAADERRRLTDIAQTLKVRPNLIEDRVARLIADNKELERKVTSLEATNANSAASDLASQIVDVDGISLIAAKVEVADRDGLLAMADSLRDALGETAVALLAAVVDGRPALLVMSTKAAFKNRGLKAGDLINDVASYVDGRGGGKPTLAQAGGKNAAGIPDALSAFEGAVRARLG